MVRNVSPAAQSRGGGAPSSSSGASIVQQTADGATTRSGEHTIVSPAASVVGPHPIDVISPSIAGAPDGTAIEPPQGSSLTAISGEASCVGGASAPSRKRNVRASSRYAARSRVQVAASPPARKLST